MRDEMAVDFDDGTKKVPSSSNHPNHCWHRVNPKIKSPQGEEKKEHTKFYVTRR
jgi:hypothetical protein